MQNGRALLRHFAAPHDTHRCALATFSISHMSPSKILHVTTGSTCCRWDELNISLNLNAQSPLMDSQSCHVMGSCRCNFSAVCSAAHDPRKRILGCRVCFQRGSPHLKRACFERNTSFLFLFGCWCQLQSRGRHSALYQDFVSVMLRCLWWFQCNQSHLKSYQITKNAASLWFDF